MSGSVEETRTQKKERSTLADLLNNVALPAEKQEAEQATAQVSNAAESGGMANYADRDQHEDEQTLIDTSAADNSAIDNSAAHEERANGRAATNRHHQDDGAHKGVVMDIWGESKKGNATRAHDADATNAPPESATPGESATPAEGAPFTTASTSAANPQGALPAVDSAAKWGESPESAERSDPISIKGRADGISIEVGRGSWSALMEQLTQRLGAAAGFFRGGSVTLNVGIRPLQDSELQQIRELLERFGMTLGVVRSSSEQTCQAALALGLAASLDAVNGIQAQTALTNHDTLSHFVYRGNLRSGQILKRVETVLILGDVNPGAQVVSDGDILIWGRLRGIAHAGFSGDTKSTIGALLMEPTQLRIGPLIAVLPDGESPSWMGKVASNREEGKRPEIAYISDDQVILDPWDQSKPGGIMAYRR